MTTISPPTHILIIGAGVFGLSTTLSLLSRPEYRSTHITILDASPTLPNPSGSSVDSSRIVRADYANAAYAHLAVSAQKHWRDRSTAGWGGEDRYHEPGFVLTEKRSQSDYVSKCFANVQELAEKGVGLDVTHIERLEDVEAIKRASGYEHVSGDRGYINRGSGWADAEACVRFALEKVKREGGERIGMRAGVEVKRLLYEGVSSKCIGAELEDGERISADLTIVAAGAWSPSLVNLQGRAVATGQALAYLKISEEEQKMLENRPTVINMSTGMFVIPPRNRELKIARHGYGYRNLKKIKIDQGHSGVNGQTDEFLEVSVPAVGMEIPSEARKACLAALGEFLPGMVERGFSRTRICWYCDTPDGDFIIDHHPDHEGLFVATGGSGHGFKFFPVIGDKIVDAVEGKLEPELKKLWTWRTSPIPDLDGCDDGSRSGTRGLTLDEALAG